jgi:hypothetical protein
MALLGAAQANAANDAQNRAYGWKKKMEEAGESSAFLSNAIQQRQLGTQTQQKMRSVNEEIQMISRKGNQVAATAAVRATKGGVNADSASVVALQQQFGKDAMQAIGVRDVEGQGILTMSQQTAKAIELQTQARIDSVQAGPAPDKRAQFAGILMGAAQGYMQGQSMQGGITPTGNPPMGAMPTNIPAGAIGNSALTSTSTLGMSAIAPTVSPLTGIAPNLGISSMYPSLTPTALAPNWWENIFSTTQYTQPSALSIGSYY